MAVSRVKVGVRVRPLVSKELSQGCVLSDYDDSSIEFKGQTFTFDHIFGMELSQTDLYQQTAAPMLKSFMEGYNVTIIAYGQTGSGKTYTMGTSEAMDGAESQGLIPRFLADLFDNLSNGVEGARLETKIQVSYIEIYGEDVYDLISRGRTTGNSSTNNSVDRASLPVREDESGRVFIQGLTDVDADSASTALDILSQGARNRITASTAMNAGSSRSHAVFTVTLHQTVQSEHSSDDVHIMSSKLTFVDLAGSERIKRTGAEGQRLKEGIQINSGLFNLGQVINSLADEQKLKSNAKGFVPYRNSKLTHLLKDALGGNSQTLFLACVSPAESNESETYSTLSYARQARNIQNKPVKNTDKLQLELRRLKYAVKTWMLKAISHMFSNKSLDSARSTDDGVPESPRKPINDDGNSSTSMIPFSSPMPQLTPPNTKKSSSNNPVNGVPAEYDYLLQRPDVQQYIEAVNAAINGKLDCNAPSPRKVRLSLASPNLRHLPTSKAKQMNLYAASNNLGSLHPEFLKPITENNEEDRCGSDDFDENDLGVNLFVGTNNNNNRRGRARESILTGELLKTKECLSEAQDPEESEKLVARLMEMMNNEKSNENEEFDNEDNEIIEVDRAIEEKEEIMNKLVETIKGYATMKTEFEKLVDAIGSLESERNELELELEKAKKVADNAAKMGSSSNTAESATVDRIKDRFLKVKEELKKMKEDRSSKENAYRIMQRESKKVEVMQKELLKLKENKVALIKQQKNQSQQLQKLKKDQMSQLSALKKGDLKRMRQVNTLKNELIKKERVLGHKDREISRIVAKLKACEDHITQLLKIQNRNRNNGTRIASGSSNASNQQKLNGDSEKILGGKFGQMNSADLEHFQTSKSILDNLVLDRLDRRRTKQQYDLKAQELVELNKDLTLESSELDQLSKKKKNLKRQLKFNPLKGGEGEDDEFLQFLEDLGLELIDGLDLSEMEALKSESRQVLEDIRVVEGNIERIAREQDFINGDLAHISSCLEKDQLIGEESNIWEGLGRDIVNGLSPVQLTSLVWDLLGDKSDSLTSQHAAQESVIELKGQLVSAHERIAQLETQLLQSELSHAQKMTEAEKQRVQDVWSVMQATQQKNFTANTQCSETSTQVALQRALDLEKELENYLSTESALRDDLGSLKQENNFLREKLLAEELASVNEVSNALPELQTLWDSIGLTNTDRENKMQQLKCSSKKVFQDALDASKTQSAELQRELDEKTANISLMQHLLGCDNAAVDSTITTNSSLLTRLAEVTSTEFSLKQLVAGPINQVVEMKEKLSELNKEMWLETEELPELLRNLSKVATQFTVGDDVLPICLDIRNNNLKLTADELSKISSALSKQNIARMQIVSKLVAIRVDVALLSQSLDLADRESLASLLASSVTSDPTDFGCNEMDLSFSVTQRAATTVVEIILSQCDPKGNSMGGNPPGSAQLLSAIEKLKLILETIRSNREMVHKHISTFGQSMGSQSGRGLFDNELLAGENTCSFNKAELSALLTPMMTMRTGCTIGLCKQLSHMDGLLGEIKPTSSIEDRNNAMEKLITSNLQAIASKDSKILNRLVGAASMSDSIEALDESSMFLEESWLKISVQKVVREWSSRQSFSVNINNSDERVQNYLHMVTKSTGKCSGQELSLLAMALELEISRLSVVLDASRELLKHDNALKKHVSEMEEYETQSKLNRSKLLSGNSKALVEEEKFRKNSKKKYEVFCDRILNAAATIQQCIYGTEATSIAIEFSGVTAAVSSQTQSIIRGSNGKIQERLELMHLHTTTHGTRRWSGEHQQHNDNAHHAAQQPSINVNNEVSSSKSKLAIKTDVLVTSASTSSVGNQSITKPSGLLSPNGFNSARTKGKPTKDSKKTVDSSAVVGDENVRVN